MKHSFLHTTAVILITSTIAASMTACSAPAGDSTSEEASVPTDDSVSEAASIPTDDSVPESTPAPAVEESEPETDSAQSTITKLPLGSEITADLDRDGSPESILMSCDYSDPSTVTEAWIQINGSKTVSTNGLTDNTVIFEPQGYLLEMNNGDKYIAFEVPAIDDIDAMSRLYRYEDGNLIEVFNFLNLVHDSEYYNYSPSNVVSVAGDTINVRTYFQSSAMPPARATFTISCRGGEVELVSRVADIEDPDQSIHTQYHALTIDVPCYADETAETPDFTVPAGTDVLVTKVFTGSDTGICRFYLETSSGLAGWFDGDVEGTGMSGPILSGTYHAQ